MLILIIGVFTYILVRSNNNWGDYKSKELNGIVTDKTMSNSGILVKISNIEKWYNLGIGISAMKHIEIGDSISKPANSKLLYLFKKDSLAWYPPYFELH